MNKQFVIFSPNKGKYICDWNGSYTWTRELSRARKYKARYAAVRDKLSGTIVLNANDILQSE